MVGIGVNCDTEAETKKDLINCQLCGYKMQSHSHWYLWGYVCVCMCIQKQIYSFEKRGSL